ncbi:MAG TPA: LysE family transporter [Micromonosporaceae bacterium]
MTDAVLSGLLAGYGVAIPVGAIAVLIMSLSARAGLRVGAAAGLGAATADGTYALVAVLAGAAVSALLRPIGGPLRVVAAVLLAAFAARTAILAWRHRDDAPGRRADLTLGTPTRAYLGVLGLTLLNPATVVYFSVLVLGDQAGRTRGAAASAAFVLAVALASASWQMVFAGGGSVLGRLLSGPRGRLATALASSAVIAVLALRLL